MLTPRRHLLRARAGAGISCPEPFEQEDPKPSGESLWTPHWMEVGGGHPGRLGQRSWQPPSRLAVPEEAPAAPTPGLRPPGPGHEHRRCPLPAGVTSGQGAAGRTGGRAAAQAGLDAHPLPLPGPRAALPASCRHHRRVPGGRAWLHAGLTQPQATPHGTPWRATRKEKRLPFAPILSGVGVAGH